MKLRKYRSSDLKSVCQLFYETITTVNICDYNSEQIKVWSNRRDFLLQQDNYFNSLYTIVAIKDNKIVGYGNIDKVGYLDHLYIHKDYQGQHIATLICNELENHLKIKRFSVHASISAKAFFEKRGYKVVKEQRVKIDNIYLNNYVMNKLI